MKFSMVVMALLKTSNANNHGSYVYIMRFENGETKIGISWNVGERLIALEKERRCTVVSCYHTSKKVRKARGIEKSAHEHFLSRHIFGEYFSVPIQEASQCVKELSNILYKDIDVVEFDINSFKLIKEAKRRHQR